MAGSGNAAPKCSRTLGGLFFILAVAAVSSGCTGIRCLLNRDPFGPCARRTLPPNPTPAQLVQLLNENVERMSSWRSTQVDIQLQGVPFKLRAELAVERPLNFRLFASSLQGSEVDIGSNAERFWFWVRRSEPSHIMTVRHKQMEDARHRLRIPFQPDWIMEVFGVIPFLESELMVEFRPDSERAYLTSERLSPQGELVRKVTVVDTRHGRILEHTLYDAANRMVARATLSDHRIDRQSGAVYPGKIELVWPEAQMALSMNVRSIEIQPLHLPPQLWTMPQYPGYPIEDLGQ